MEISDEWETGIIYLNVKKSDEDYEPRKFTDKTLALSVTYPSMLDEASPRIRAYPMVTMLEEKCAIMVELGFANSRMKDFSTESELETVIGGA